MKWLGENNLHLGSRGFVIPGGEISAGDIPGSLISYYIDKGLIETNKEKPDEVTVDVGTMTATVTAGDDNKLGTEDDKVSIKPKRRGRPKKVKKSDG